MVPNNNKASRNWKYVLGVGANLEAKPMGPILPLFFLPMCLGFPCATFSEAKQPGTSNWPLREHARVSKEMCNYGVLKVCVVQNQRVGDVGDVHVP